ncbi:MAG: hypothetical protein JWL79_1759 [Frankiales bacterium]|nr:hypothetical protein [Frankiales bacterium]
MSRRTALWILIEGRITDAAFYDRLLAANAKASAVGFDVRLVETLKMSPAYGGAAGGKQRALKLFDYFKRTRKLTQMNRAGTRRIVFMLDRDLDFLTGSNRRSDHVIYTSARDAEAELHINGDLPAALGTALSLTGAEQRKVAKHVGDHVRALADSWVEWIRIGALVAGLRPYPCAIRPGKVSAIHVSAYGSLDLAKLAQVQADIIANAQVQNVSTRRKFIENRVAAFYSRGEQHLLVKGKWLPAHLNHVVRSAFPSKPPVDFNGIHVVSKILLHTLDFTAPWSAPYHRAINKVA